MLRNVLLIIAGLVFLYGLFTAGAPFLLAMIFAILLEPLNELLMRGLKVNRIIAATLTCTLFVLAVLGLFYVLIARIVAEFVSLVRSLNYNEIYAFVMDGIARFETMTGNLPPEVAHNIRVYAMSQLQWLQGMAGRLPGYTFHILSTLPKGFIFLIVFIVALYLFAYGMNGIKQNFLSLFEEKSRAKVGEVLENLKLALFGFLRGQLILSLLIFIITFAGLMMLRVPYAMVISFVIIIVDVLPILGTGTVLIPWAIYCIAAGDISLGIGLIVLYLVITIFRRIVEPKILGDSMGISAIATLVSMYVGFELIGAAGLFLGPVVVILYQAMRKAGLLHMNIRLE